MRTALLLCTALAACGPSPLQSLRPERAEATIPNMDFAPASEATQKGLAGMEAPASGQVEIRALDVEDQEQIQILARANGRPTDQTEALLLRLCIRTAQGTIESAEALSFGDQDEGRAVICNTTTPADQLLARMTPFG